MGDPIPAWAWVLIEDYVDRCLEDRRTTNPTAQETLAEVARLWPDLTCTILVQEPWQGTVRFKRLAQESRGYNNGLWATRFRPGRGF